MPLESVTCLAAAIIIAVVWMVTEPMFARARRRRWAIAYNAEKEADVERKLLARIVADRTRKTTRSTWEGWVDEKPKWQPDPDTVNWNSDRYVS